MRRKSVAKALVQKNLIKGLSGTANTLRPWLPEAIQKQLPVRQSVATWPAPKHARKMLVLAGCVQPALAPETNLKTALVLDQLGISLLQEDNTGCCGAVGLHTSDHEMGLRHIRERIDHWWPFIAQTTGPVIEAIIFTASGCGVTIKDYGYLLKDDKTYAEKAERVSAMAKDISEVILAEIKTNQTYWPSNVKLLFIRPAHYNTG